VSAASDAVGVLGVQSRGAVRLLPAGAGDVRRPEGRGHGPPRRLGGAAGQRLGRPARRHRQGEQGRRLLLPEPLRPAHPALLARQRRRPWPAVRPLCAAQGQSQDQSDGVSAALCFLAISVTLQFFPFIQVFIRCIYSAVSYSFYQMLCCLICLGKCTSSV